MSVRQVPPANEPKSPEQLACEQESAKYGKSADFFMAGARDSYSPDIELEDADLETWSNPDQKQAYQAGYVFADALGNVETSTESGS